jgi:1,4-dihydroxy-2-naphthoyl-CoA synthase
MEGTTMTETTHEVIAELRGQVGCITLNRPRALNALSLGMVRELMAVLLDWQKNDQVLAVAIRGSNKEGARSAPSAPVATSAFCTRPAARATRSSRTSSPRNTPSTT